MPPLLTAPRPPTPPSRLPFALGLGMGHLLTQPYGVSPMAKPADGAEAGSHPIRGLVLWHPGPIAPPPPRDRGSADQKKSIYFLQGSPGAQV